MPFKARAGCVDPTQSGLSRRLLVNQTLAQLPLHRETRWSLLADLESHFSPPAPLPEPPEPEVVEQPAEETGRLDYPKLHRWF
jgi:hypothetical protein